MALARARQRLARAAQAQQGQGAWATRASGGPLGTLAYRLQHVDASGR